MPGIPAQVKTSVFGTWSLHLTPRMHLRLRIGNELSRLSLLFFRSGVEGPTLTAIQKSGEDASTVYCHLGVDCELAVVPYSPSFV